MEPKDTTNKVEEQGQSKLIEIILLNLIIFSKNFFYFKFN